MTEAAYVTRDQATGTAAIPDTLVELMARTAYEASRPAGSGRPEWGRCTDEWRSAMCREMRAAVTAAVVAGRLAVLPA